MTDMTNFGRRPLVKIAERLWPTWVAKLRRLKHDHLMASRFRYYKDGLATIHNCDALQDPVFVRAYELAKQTGSWNFPWGLADPEYRTYIICWAARKGVALEGDFVECGVNKGGYSRAAMHYIGFQNLSKRFYLLDTFAGLVDAYLSSTEKEISKIYDYQKCYADVQKTFQEFGDRVILVRGAVPETLPRVEAQKICYLSLDMNCTQPEIAAAEFFWEKLVSGAVIVLDDYGGDGHQEQREAFNEFAKTRGVQVLSLPTGQGLIFKP